MMSRGCWAGSVTTSFVFANIICGNGGNGVRVQNAHYTAIHANFFGLGYDNKTPVSNALDGVLFEGTSANNRFGGVIPLGNVSAANGRNGWNWEPATCD